MNNEPIQQVEMHLQNIQEHSTNTATQNSLAVFSQSPQQSEVTETEHVTEAQPNNLDNTLQEPANITTSNSDRLLPYIEPVSKIDDSDFTPRFSQVMHIFDKDNPGVITAFSLQEPFSAIEVDNNIISFKITHPQHKIKLFPFNIDSSKNTQGLDLKTHQITNMFIIKVQTGPNTFVNLEFRFDCTNNTFNFSLGMEIDDISTSEQNLQPPKKYLPDENAVNPEYRVIEANGKFIRFPSKITFEEILEGFTQPFTINSPNDQSNKLPFPIDIHITSARHIQEPPSTHIVNEIQYKRLPLAQ